MRNYIRSGSLRNIAMVVAAVLGWPCEIQFCALIFGDAAKISSCTSRAIDGENFEQL